MVSSVGAGADEGTTSGVVVAPDVDGPGAGAVVGPDYASWGQRVFAALLDNAILAGVTWLALGQGFGATTLTLGWGETVDEARAGGPLVLIPVAALVALLVLQALTGWTPGKLVTGIRMVREQDHRPAGLWKTVARWALHLLDAIFLIGYLRPIWHAERQTFADSIARTVVLREVLDLPRRPRIVLYSAAVVTCVLGLGYGYVPISSGSAADVADGSPLCEVETQDPALIAGQIRPAGSVSIERDRRLWTVRETRTTHPGAALTWTSGPSARDTDYRVELDARPGPDEQPVISRSWDIGSGGLDSWTENYGYVHGRTLAVSEDTHDAEVGIAGTGAEDEALIEDELAALDAEPWIDVRLLADGEVVAECRGPVTYQEPTRN